jgi:multiple sugar transport system ATP-binding protein
MAGLSLRGIRKRYGEVDVIRGVDLEVRDGEFLVLVGPSGCGKSTLLRMIAGLESISEGTLMLDRRVANDLHPAERGAAMVFQSYALYPHMTVAENMGFALRMAGVARPQRDEQVRRAAEALHITGLLGRYPRQLSGGERQRVAIGRAIVRQPQVFLFDEPLSNLDAALRVSMRIELARLHRALGTTMIYVTHDQVEAMTLGDRIAVVNQGRIEQVGPPLELYERPANRFVASFLGAPRINLVECPPPDAPAPLRALWQQLAAAAPQGTRAVGLRPEHLSVVAAGDGVAAEVVLAEHLGDATIVHLRLAGMASLLHARLPADSGHWLPGQAVVLQPPPARTLHFDGDGRRLD